MGTEIISHSCGYLAQQVVQSLSISWQFLICMNWPELILSMSFCGKGSAAGDSNSPNPACGAGGSYVAQSMVQWLRKMASCCSPRTLLYDNQRLVRTLSLSSALWTVGLMTVFLVGGGTSILLPGHDVHIHVKKRKKCIHVYNQKNLLTEAKASEGQSSTFWLRLGEGVWAHLTRSLNSTCTCYLCQPGVATISAEWHWSWLCPQWLLCHFLGLQLYTYLHPDALSQLVQWQFWQARLKWLLASPADWCHWWCACQCSRDLGEWLTHVHWIGGDFGWCHTWWMRSSSGWCHMHWTWGAVIGGTLLVECLYLDFGITLVCIYPLLDSECLIKICSVLNSSQYFGQYRCPFTNGSKIYRVLNNPQYFGKYWYQLTNQAILNEVT